jgi:hypothetical protein
MLLEMLSALQTESWKGCVWDVRMVPHLELQTVPLTEWQLELRLATL